MSFLGNALHILNEIALSFLVLLSDLSFYVGVKFLVIVFTLTDFSNVIRISTSFLIYCATALYYAI